MTLLESLDKVHDSASFLEFVRLLLLDRQDEVRKESALPSPPCGPGANGWEHHTIESFLEGASSWARDTDFGVSQGLEKANPWLTFATFLYCGKIYQ